MIEKMNKVEPKTSITKLCKLFEIPVSIRYYKPVINVINQEIMTKMKQIYQDNFQSCGKRRMVVALEEQGIHIGIFKAVSLMKQANIIAKFPKKPHYYQGGKKKPNIPNLLREKV